jgi:hypothetical protein
VRGGIDVHDEAIRKAERVDRGARLYPKFHGRFTVIKLGGSVMEDPEALRACWSTSSSCRPSACAR